MTTLPTVSVVIVSQHRQEELRRCLIALSQMTYNPFEVVIVADPATCTGLRSLPQAAHAKVIVFHEANISAARNAGIVAAAGDIVAFVDDDAVPEPTWLDFLTTPFQEPGVAVVGGFVRGRNGISWQSRARWVDRTGATGPLNVNTTHATVLTPTADKAIKTEGTNTAVRRELLAKLGGFDPNFRFFLDETDLNLRVAALGMRTAIAPLAHVHHSFAASSMRRGDRAPVDLLEIGASWAVFLRKHCDPDERAAVWRRVKFEQQQRVLSHMISGRLEPRDVRRLLKKFEQGIREGNQRALHPLPELTQEVERFRPYSGGTKRKPAVIAGRFWSRRKLMKQARELATTRPVTVIRLSPTALFHRVRFIHEGVWLQTGGLFGKSDRAQPIFSYWTFDRRVRFELDRVRAVRGLTG